MEVADYKDEHHVVIVSEWQRRFDRVQTLFRRSHSYYSLATSSSVAASKTSSRSGDRLFIET